MVAERMVGFRVLGHVLHYPPPPSPISIGPRHVRLTFRGWTAREHIVAPVMADHGSHGRPGRR